MNNILSEKEYQRFIIDKLVAENGYIERKNVKFDRNFAIDREMLFKFLDDTQSETMAQIRKVYKDVTEDTVINFINTEITKAKSSLLSVLKHGVEIAGYKVDLMYTKPATTFNKDLLAKYNKNIFSVMEEVWASDTERIDLVVFLNGFAIMSFELKCNFAGQSYQDAILQYRTQRNPKTRLFYFKAGCIVNFAMDLQEVYMTTRLANDGTFFLPFNMGSGTGIDAGKGNPVYPDKYSVYYMWEDILKKDTVLDLISEFIFIERKEETDEVTGKTTVKEKVVFPRYHQLDVIRKTIADVEVNRTSQNYLIQHSAGSGKTNSIAWLAHRLSSLHDEENKIVFDNIIICTDRVVVDRQLQDAVRGIEHKTGLIKVMDDKCSSADLALALQSNIKIIGTTIQKFPYIVDTVKNLKNKTFAVIIDEAHSSTAGKDMAAITMTLGAGEVDFEEGVVDTQDMIADEIRRNGKQKNVSMFAFTATPKATTLDLFGRLNAKGQKEAFHLYSMKQAIEEGFILDVLANFTEYNTYYRLNKEISEDPKYKTAEAKKQIARFVELHETNIAQRVEVIVEHFRTTVLSELGGMAKAMVVTASRASAVKYRQAFEDYVTKKGYAGIHALVAFSGKVKLPDDETEYTETLLNGFSEDKLPKKFDSDDYNVLLVANKYQTGFDQPKLCAMYVLKKLRGVNAVQTLSRLNRICPPFEKKTFVLDFVNTYDDIVKAFAPYYTTTLLANSVTPTAVYDLEAKLDGYMILDPYDVNMAAEIIYKKIIESKDKNQLRFYLQRAEKKLKEYDLMKQIEIMAVVRHFIRFYEFLIQVSCFEDVELHKKYLFLTYFVSFVNISQPGGGFDLSGKIKADNFIQKKGEEHKTTKVTPDPIVKLPTADDFNLNEDKVKRLSEIIDEINSKTGKTYDNDVVIKAMLQIKDLMMKSEKLRESAKANTESDFAFSYFDGIDDALIEGLSQNQDFFSLLLSNDEMKKEVLGIFVSEIYKSLREDNYLVFHVKADNSVENLVPTVADGKISFETSSFSYFIIAEAAPAEHVHDYVWVEGTEPTCEEEGVVAHYHCDGCGKNFDPNYGEVETVSIPKAEHEYGSMYWGKSANFWEDGNIEYYQCAVCEKYFDAEYNEVESPVIPKYSTNLSICVNGTPTALVLGEHNENFIEWSLEGLSVTKGDVITLCQTDNAEIVHNYFAEGNVDEDGKILTTAAAANVVLTATPNGLTLFIDGYKYEGIVIEINGVQYPMVYTAYLYIPKEYRNEEFDKIVAEWQETFKNEGL